MSENHPYISSPGPIIKLVKHLTKTLPPKIDAQTLKKLGLAPNNESYAINILRFIGVIDEEGKITAEARKVFTSHPEEAFQKAFSGQVKKAYSDLFSNVGDAAWDADEDQLITYFRGSDQTSAIVSKRQAKTFSALASLAGHGELPTFNEKASQAAKQRRSTSKKETSKTTKAPPTPLIKGNETPKSTDFALTVRVEINLPAEGDQKTYDRIFKSIKENLLNGA